MEKTGKWILLGAIALVVVYKLFIDKDDNTTVTPKEDEKLGEPQYGENGVRIPYFYAVARYDAVPIFIMGQGGVMQKMNTTLANGTKVSVMDENGEYWKIDCDGLFVKKSDVTKI